jgi:hypothetical protein
MVWLVEVDQEKVEAAERIIVELRGMLDASRAELTKARRPWWRRWITRTTKRLDQAFILRVPKDDIPTQS